MPAVLHLHDQPLQLNKIICIGRNYAEHVREMGNDPKESQPVYFFKPASAFNTTGVLTYPAFTNDLHYELELVVVLSKGGSRLEEAEAGNLVGGFAVGLDMTCRDLQRQAKAQGGPWEAAKAFDGSAPCSTIEPATAADLARLGTLRLELNGEPVQQGHVRQMIWSVPQLISRLSHFFELQAGDLIYTGTPAGVGPVQPGDRLRGTIEGIPAELNLHISEQ